MSFCHWFLNHSNALFWKVAIYQIVSSFHYPIISCITNFSKADTLWICDHFLDSNVGWEGKTTSWSILHTCITLKTIADYIWVPKILITGMGKIPIAGGNIWTQARTAGLSWRRISIVTIDASVKANSFY